MAGQSKVCRSVNATYETEPLTLLETIMLTDQERIEQDEWMREMCNYQQQHGAITSIESDLPITDDDLGQFNRNR